MNSLFQTSCSTLSVSPEDQASWAGLKAKSSALEKGIVGGIVGLDKLVGVLELEVSRGRTSASDLKELLAKSKVLLGRLIGMGSFRVGAKTRFFLLCSSWGKVTKMYRWSFVFRS